MNYDSYKEQVICTCNDIINNCDRMTSGNYMHNINAIKLMAKIIRDNCLPHLFEKPQSPWISVEDKLPETTDEFGRSEDVLILNENGEMTVAMYCIPENKWYLSVGAIQGDCEYPFEITHWMPIPKLQEELL
jgi:hypothetical protein